jgi:hypothetical protein
VADSDVGIVALVRTAVRCDQIPLLQDRADGERGDLEARVVGAPRDERHRSVERSECDVDVFLQPRRHRLCAQDALLDVVETGAEIGRDRPQRVLRRLHFCPGSDEAVLHRDGQR